MNAGPASGRTPSIYRMADCRHGRFLYNRNDTYIGRSLELYGEWSEAEVRLFRQIVRPGDVILEAGANIGTHTVFLSAATGDAGKVLAFEPARHTHQLLCANLALNDCLNVHAYNKAVGRTIGTVRFPAMDPRCEGNFGGASLRSVDRLADSATETVEMQTIDGLALPRLDFIKSDVEGYEGELLMGAQQTLRDLRPVVYLEIDIANGLPTGNRDELLRILGTHGYSAYYYFAPMFLPDNVRGATVDVFRSASLDMICVPDDRAQVDGLTKAGVGDEVIKIYLESLSVEHSALPWSDARFSYL